MLYHWYEIGHAAVKPARLAANNFKLFFKNPLNPLTHTHVGRQAAAVCEVFERTTRRYEKPEFRIKTTVVDGRTVGVREEAVWKRPFCNLLHFVRDVPRERALKDPRVLLVAPMSGHYATLLRGTVEALLPDHEVYITDWLDVRDVPLAAGRFDLDDYIDYVRDMLRHLDGDVHAFAVCQPSVPVLAAVALMEQESDPCVPHSLTLAGGPVDTRINPTEVNRLAEEKGTQWFRNNVVTTVPWPAIGYGRAVYPGFLQLTGFMTMNLDRHLTAHKDLFLHLVHGDGDSAEKHREFYDEYLAVMDLTAEFYLQTIDTVFVRHALPKGEFVHRGQRLDLASIKRVAIMTIEGEKDDITGVGQCRAVLDLARNVPDEMKLHYECPGVGHYGIFNGSRFRADIAPRIAQFMRSFDPRRGNIPVEMNVPNATAVSRAATRNVSSQPLETAAFTFGASHQSSRAARTRGHNG
ncbi:MAG: polyhydroxyalkanoate depolymerase [Hyphomicrobiaceae bacterium]|nr:polyhydroxyalkanoate depolymerase [Hyphomicrobiaceae bacterium]